jgi:hypothetical protein
VVNVRTGKKVRLSRLAQVLLCKIKLTYLAAPRAKDLTSLPHPQRIHSLRIFFPFPPKYSGDLNTEHLNTGTIQIPDKFKSGIQTVSYVFKCLVHSYKMVLFRSSNQTDGCHFFSKLVHFVLYTKGGISDAQF